MKRHASYVAYGLYHDFCEAVRDSHRSLSALPEPIWLDDRALPENMARGTRGAYRREDRVALPPELQKELVEKAAAKFGNCQELAKHLDIPKSSVHYYRVGRLTLPLSIIQRMQEIAGDRALSDRISAFGIEKDRTWANEHAASVFREMCRDRLRLPTVNELERDAWLRRRAASLISYVLAEGSVWIKGNRYDEGIVNVTFADHEEDLYRHFQQLCRDVFNYSLGNPQPPGNGAKAVRGFIYSTFVAQWSLATEFRLGTSHRMKSTFPNGSLTPRIKKPLSLQYSHGAMAKGASLDADPEGLDSRFHNRVTRVSISGPPWASHFEGTSQRGL